MILWVIQKGFSPEINKINNKDAKPKILIFFKNTSGFSI